tara:strand:- start:1260 stop:1577 length:318 start_codon:yes stop_codon:yes gene_type:complete
MIIILIISALLNIFFIWYVYQLLKKLLFVSENIGDLLETLESFAEHLETVYKLETYYGDQTLENLLEHSKGIVEEVRAYRDIYDITQNEDLEEFEEYDGETTTEE